jgi:fatty-acyl-CoA synthase
MREQPHLQPGPANHRPLSPVDFLLRARTVFRDRPAVVWRERSWTYAQFADIVARFAAELRSRGVGKGDVVSILAQNRPEMLAAHYAVPLVGAVLNTINTRLDPDTIAYIFGHSECVLLIADKASRERAEAALKLHDGDLSFAVLAEPGAGSREPGVLDLFDGRAERADLDAAYAIEDEWQPICLNYTSGTTGRPKGVVYHHRGAYLNALGNVLALKLDERSSYLWTLPMFHCNGWCHTWAVTAAGALHVCLERIDAQDIFAAIDAHGVTHLSCAPVVLYMLVNHPARAGRDASRRLTAVTGGAAPTSALIEELDAIGMDIIHLYGLTESFGPATLCILDEHG